MNTYGDAAISAEKCSILALNTYDSSQQHVSNSTINLVNTHGETRVFLTNSTCSDFTISNQSRVFVYWYLDVNVVDDLYNNVPSANVTATFPNSTQAESKLTNSIGWARLALMEKMMNVTGNHPVGNYTIEATYLAYSNTTSVNMTENQQISLRLEGFIVPEFPSLLILQLFMIATLLAITLHKKKYALPARVM
jgi:hypothetical protein